MAQVIVRNLPDGVVAALKRRASSKGRALEQELREILTEASNPTRVELVTELARCRALTPTRHRTMAEHVIRSIRDEQ